MSVINQINHRQKYFELKAAGKLPDYTANRHTGKLPTPVLTAPKKSTKHPLQRDDGSKMTLAERLGIELPPPADDDVVEPTPAVKSVLPRSIIPAANANVPVKADPFADIDPMHDMGDLPPIGKPQPYEPAQGHTVDDDEDADDSPLI